LSLSKSAGGRSGSLGHVVAMPGTSDVAEAPVAQQLAPCVPAQGADPSMQARS